jgi:hypothetical protein
MRNREFFYDFVAKRETFPLSFFSNSQSLQVLVRWRWVRCSAEFAELQAFKAFRELFMLISTPPLD